jgi:hypothetical protein
MQSKNYRPVWKKLRNSKWRWLKRSPNRCYKMRKKTGKWFCKVDYKFKLFSQICWNPKKQVLAIKFDKIRLYLSFTYFCVSKKLWTLIFDLVWFDLMPQAHQKKKFANWIPISYSLYPIYFKFTLIAIWDFLFARFSLLCHSNAFGISKFSSYFGHVWKNQVVRCGGLWWDGRTIGEILIISGMMVVVHITTSSV